MALYDHLFFKVNTELVGEELEADISFESDIARVLTIPGGFSGITPGSPVVVITLKSAVPTAGQEYDFAHMMINSIPFEGQATLGASGESCTVPEMYVVGPVKLSTGIGKTTEQDVQFVGRAPNPPWV